MLPPRLRAMLAVMTRSRNGSLAGVFVGACFATVLVATAVAGGLPHVGAAKRQATYVSGRLSIPGYTIAVVGYNGKNVVSSKQSFRLLARDTRVTLQLINPRGLYTGPVVVGGSASKAVVGFKAPANVGTIIVVPAKGYGHLAHSLAAKYLDRSRWAYAKHGVPIGNGTNFGLVVSKSRGTANGPGLDPAHVGIPSEFDIAVPGTKVLSALAPAANRRTNAKPAAECPPPPQRTPPGCTTAPPPTESTEGTANLPGWLTSLNLPINLSVNEDAAGVTLAEIDSSLQANLHLGLISVPASASLVELSCYGLVFCSQGGGGEADLGGSPSGGSLQNVIPFPGGALDPATGLGELVGPQAPTDLLSPAPNQLDGFTLLPHATSAQVGSGDVITENVTIDKTTTQTPTTLDFVFVTVPALSSYADTAGDSATITYPEPTPAGPGSALGTASAPIKVAPGVVTLRFFRPQRLGIPGAGEPQFMDIGHLNYTLSAAPMQSGGPTPGGSGECPAAAYSQLSPTLTLTSGVGHHSAEGVLIDSAADQPASPANTLSVTVDLSKCSAGASRAGQPTRVDLGASTSHLPTDATGQTFWVERSG
jgi:hypothetical protein